MNLANVMKSISTKMKAEYEESSNLNHGGLKGDSRENTVKNFLEKYLVDKFGITRGEIVSIDGETSKQQDIVIYDSHVCPVLYNAEDIRVVPVEGTYVVIEVKSLLSDSELENSILNISSVKKLEKKSFVLQQGPLIQQVTELGKTKNYYNTMGVLFAYRSNLSLDSIKRRIAEQYRKHNIPTENQIDFIFVLDRGFVVPYCDATETISTTNELDTKMCVMETKDGLLLFYSFLMDRLGQAFTPPIDVKLYAQNLEYDIKC
jgi:hypothetical protein